MFNFHDRKQGQHMILSQGDTGGTACTLQWRRCLGHSPHLTVGGFWEHSLHLTVEKTLGAQPTAEALMFPPPQRSRGRWLSIIHSAEGRTPDNTKGQIHSFEKQPLPLLSNKETSGTIDFPLSSLKPFQGKETVQEGLGRACFFPRFPSLSSFSFTIIHPTSAGRQSRKVTEPCLLHSPATGKGHTGAGHPDTLKAHRGSWK